MKDKILLIGAQGQIGKELIEKISLTYGEQNIVATDIKPSSTSSVVFEQLDVLDTPALLALIKKHKITTVYLLAALLSAVAENNFKLAWEVNMNGLLSILDMAKEGIIKRLFFPSSIGVFGENTPKINTPQETITQPTTVYGITKYSGELLCDYYYKKYKVDVRGIRYPGLIGYKALPGGGTTDYAVDIFHQAIKHNKYTCFLSKNTALPMMYMPDAIRATIELMQYEGNSFVKGKCYNISAMSFSPSELANEIKKHLPEFSMCYAPDYRQNLADGWPKSIDDTVAEEEWGWKAQYDLSRMTEDMMKNLK